MTSPSQVAHAWNKALLSVYYHGRRDEPPLRGEPPPLGVWSLARAVSVLSTAPVGAQRLALADLCRTRAKRSTSTVVTQMRKLAGTYERATPQHLHGTSLAMAGRFDAIFVHPIQPDEAYLQAIGVMLGHESPQPLPPGSNVNVLTSYSVSPQ